MGSPIHKIKKTKSNISDLGALKRVNATNRTM